MKKITLLLAVLVSSGFLASCGWKENPLDGRGDILKQARPDGSGNEKPGGSDNAKTFVFDAPNAVNFVEGTKTELTLGVRSTEPGIKKIDLTIANMSDFPGASYDAPSKKFSWTPPFGTVANGASLQTELTLHASGLNTVTNIVNRQDQIVVLSIVKNGQDPLVKSVNFPAFSSKLREGGVYPFSVTVQDPDKLTDESKAPTVVILPPQGNLLSLGGFAHFKDRSRDAANFTYTYNYELNLVGVELTDSSKQAGFEVQAYSNFGKKSTTVPWSQTLYTKLATPSSTWLDTKMLKNNEKNVIPFIVYDPKGECLISLDRNDNVPTGGSVDCTQRLGTGSLECTLTYSPALPATSLPNYGLISMNLSTFNKDRSDTDVIKTTLKLNYQVVDGSKP